MRISLALVFLQEGTHARPLWFPAEPCDPGASRQHRPVQRQALAIQPEAMLCQEPAAK